MKPKYYLDFIANDCIEDTPVFAILGRVYRVLHGAFGGSEGSYAVAFPTAKSGPKRTTGSTIRVFSSSATKLHELIEKVHKHYIVRDYVVYGAVKSVPDNFNGKWQTWLRVRVQKTVGINKDKNIERALKSPYFDFSSSGGQGFALRMLVKDAFPQIEECFPNSYGLSVGGNLRGEGKNIFSVPVL